MRAFAVVMSVQLGTTAAQHVNSTKEPGLQQASRSVSVAGFDGSQSTSVEHDSSREPGHASTVDFHDLLVANASGSAKSTFEDLWSNSWAPKSDSALAGNTLRSSVENGARFRLRIAPQVSSRKSASDGAGVITGHAMAAAKKLPAHISIHVPLEHAATIVRDPALQVVAASDFSAQHIANLRGGVKHGGMQAETKVGTDVSVAEGTIASSPGSVRSRAEELAEQLAEQLMSPGVGRSRAEELAEQLAEQLTSPGVVRSRAEQLADQLAEQLAEQLKEHEHVRDTLEASRGDATLRAAVASSFGVVHSRAEQLADTLAEQLAEQLKVHKDVRDSLEARRGDATLRAVKPSQKQADRVSAGDTTAAAGTPVPEARTDVRQTPAARTDVRPTPAERTDVRPRSPETVSDVEQPDGANVTVGMRARLVKRGAGKQHLKSKAKRILRTKASAHAFARAPDVPTSEDFLNTLDSATLRGPLAKLLTAKREFDARAGGAADRISRDQSRVADIRSNVGALAAALANADASSSL